VNLTDRSESQAGSELGWALAALAVSPMALGGAWVRADHGPVRDQWLAFLKDKVTPCVRVPFNVDDERLLGGLDLTASLAHGTSVWHPGLLAQAEQGVVILPMAERLDASVLARILQAQERDTESLPARFGVVALDESLEDEKSCPAASPSAWACGWICDNCRPMMKFSRTLTRPTLRTRARTGCS